MKTPKILMLTVGLTLAACGAKGDPPPTPTPAAAPAEAPAAPAPAPAADPSAVLVSGTISVPDSIPEAQAVYVSLKVAGVPGPPLAAKKLDVGPFPLTFSLTEGDRPMVTGPVPEAFEIKVTLDVDGNPMSKGADDLEAILSTTKGATDVALTLAPRP